MRKTVKKLVSILGGLLLLTILTVSCNGWMQDDGFMENIEDEVSVANADRIATYVRYPNTKMGTTSPSGDAILKVNVPMDITATTNTEYGFYKWAAFKKGTGEGEFDTSKQNSSLYYKSVEYYEENYAQYELPSSVVEFVDPTAESTSVKIKEKRNDVVIVPIVVERPFYTASVPANGKSDVVLNQAIRILMSKAISGEKLAENIKITAGTAVFTEDTEDSDAEDITDRFDITLSKTGKMITCKLKSTDGENTNLMPTKSQITVTIYSDLKDTLGYTMEENQKIIFQTGSVTDTLAPKYVDNPKAGINELAKDFVFMGPKGSREALDNIFATTFNEYKTIFKDGSKYLKPLEDSSYAADTKDEDAKFVFTNYLRHRVYDKLNIVVRAADLAGSGTKADEQSAVEDDVAFIKIRSKLVRDPNNTPVTTEYSANGTIGYQAGGIDKSDDYAYKGNLTLAQATGAEEGTLFTYNLDSLLDADKNTYKLTDGLVRIDLWTVDMIGNEGKDDNYWSNWDNGLRTLYVVKDQTPPVITTSSITSGSAAIAADAAKGTKAYAAVSNNWYNPITFKNIKIAANAANAVVDPGYVDSTNPEINYAAYKNDLQWTIKINPAEDWNPATETTSWKKIYITSDSKNNVTDYEKYDFTNASVSADGVVNIKVAAKDDLGNVSAPVALGSVYYDSVNPKVDSLSWTAGSGTAGVTTGNVLTDQTLNIQLNEVTAGVQKVKIEVGKKAGDTYPSSVAAPVTSGIEVYYNGTKLNDNNTNDYSITGDTITFNPQNNYSYLTSGLLTIKGIKINDNAATAEGLYKVTVTVTDGAQNSGAESVKAIEITNDSTKPIVEKIVIPGIKKAVELTKAGINSMGTREGTTDTTNFWLDGEYIADISATTHEGNNPATRAKVEITINESNSGVKVIKFGGTAQLQSNSTLYLITSNGKTDIASSQYTVNTTANTITIINSSDSLKNFPGQSYFVIGVDNLKFTNKGGNDKPTDAGGESKPNTISVTVTDVALNVSDTTDESTKFKYKTDVTLYEKFWTDSWQCAIEGSRFYLNDADTLLGTVNSKLASTDGYTNENLITVSATLTCEGTGTSGHNKFVLTGAKFTSTTKVFYGQADKGNNSDATTYNSSYTNVKTALTTNDELPNTQYVISADGSTIELRNSAGDEYYVFRAYTSICFTNVQLDGADGEKSVSLQAYDLSGWNNPSGAKKTKSITLDTTKPEWRYGIFTAGSDKYTTGTPSVNVYPHPNGESAKGINITGKTNGDGNAVSYFYTSAIYSSKYGVILGIPCKDAIQLRGYKGKDCVSYVIYEHPDSATATMNAATVIANGTIPSEDINENTTGKGNYTEWKKEFNGWTFFEAGKTYSIVVLDEAGNYSEKAQTVSIVQDTTKPARTITQTSYDPTPNGANSTFDDANTLLNLVTIKTPDSIAKIFRNNTVSEHSRDSTSYEYFDSGSYEASLTVRDYVIKNTTDKYKVIIKLGSGTTTADILMDGSQATAKSSYVDAIPSTTSSPLDSYSISHWYGNWHTESGNQTYEPAFPSGTKAPDGTSDLRPYFNFRSNANSTWLTSEAKWHEYTKNSSSYSDGGTGVYAVSSYVDSNGDIVVEIPNTVDTPPLFLLLKDGCGNMNYIPLTVKSGVGDQCKDMVAWVVDSKLGSGRSGRNVGMNVYMGKASKETDGNVKYSGSGSANPAFNVNGSTNTERKYYGYQTSSWRPNKIGSEDGQTAIGTIARDLVSKITYYNENAYIGMFNDAESCKFATLATASSDDNNGYTVRARIRAWDKDRTAPKPEDFNGAGGEGTDFSSWYYLRDTISTGHNEYTLQYPHPTSRTEEYKLYYYVEDAVGNYEINTIVNSNSDTDMIYWMYDNVGPSVLTRSGKNPSGITGTYINDLVATNNGYRPYYNPSNNNGYIVKTTTQRSGYSLPGKDSIGKGVSIGAIGNKLKWGSYFDLDITETSGIRAFTYSTSKIADPSSLPVGAGSMGDSTTTSWYTGKDSSSGSEVDNAIDKEIGSSVTYPTSLSSEKIITNDSIVEVSHDYYKPDYGASKYSGVKVCETIPYGLVNTTAIDTLYLYLMDWVGNITEVKLGDGIKWINDAEGPGNDGSTTTAIYNDDYYIASYNNSYNLKYTYAATKSSISDASAIKVYMPATKYKDSGSGIYGWSRTQNKVTDVKTDVNGSYFEVNTDELALIKNGKTNSDLDIYVYDNVGCCNKVIVSLAGDNDPIKYDICIRGTNSSKATTESFVVDTMKKGSGYNNGNNPLSATNSTIQITTKSDLETNVTRTAFTKDGYVTFLPCLGTSEPSDLYKIVVSRWENEWKTVDSSFASTLTTGWVHSAPHTDEKYYYTTLNHQLDNNYPYYQFEMYDKAGNVSYIYTMLKADSVSPTVTAGSVTKVNQIDNENYYNANSKAVVEYSDSGSGIASYTNASGTTTNLTTYTTSIPGFEVSIGTMEPSSDKLQFTAKDNLGNGGTVNLEYNGKSDWVKDTVAPTYTQITNQSAVKKGKKNVSDTTYSNSGTNRNFTFDNCNYNKQASLYCTYNTDTKITNLIVNPQVYKFTFKLPSITDDNFYGWKVSDSLITDTWFNAKTGGQVDKYESGYSFYRNSMGAYGTQVIPENGTKVYFYPIDKAGNIGTPIILSFVSAPLPVIESITPTGTVNNYYNKNSKVNVTTKYSWGTGDMPINYIGISDEKDNYQLIDLKTKDVKLTSVGETYIFEGLSLDGITGSNIDFEIITDLTSSEVKQLKTINYDGTGPSSIKINSVSNQPDGTYVVKEDDASITYGTNASTITITPSSVDQAIDATHPIQYSSDNSTWGDTVVFTTFTGTQKIYAKDGLGNVSEQVITFTKDETAPTISSVIDNSDSITKAYRSSDTVYFASGCGDISFTVNSSDPDIRGYKMDSNAEQTSSSFSITPSTDGETHKFYAIDKVGNVSAGTTITFIADNTAPAIPTITFNNNQYVYPSILTDKAIDTSKTYYFNGNQWQTGFAVKVQSSDTAGSGLASVVISGQSGNNGSYELNPDADKEVEYTVIATDNVGHTAESKFKLYNKKTGPKPGTGVSTTTVSGKTALKNNEGASGYSVANGSFIQVRDNSSTQYGKVYLYESGTKLTIPVSDAIGVLYDSVTIGSETASYSSDVTSISGGSITVTLPDTTVFNNYLYINLKDAVGNESKYNIGNPADVENNLLSTYKKVTDYKINVSNGVITISDYVGTFAISKIEIESNEGGKYFGDREYSYTWCDEKVKFNSYTSNISYQANCDTSTAVIEMKLNSADSYADTSYFISGGTLTITTNINPLNVTKVTITDQSGASKAVTLTNNSYSPAANVNGSIAGRTLSGLKELFTPKSRKSTSTSSIAPTAATTTTAPKTKATKTKKSKTAKAPVVQELPTESFAEMPALESVDVLGALERSSNANSSADGIAVAGKTVEIVKQQAENLTAEPKVAASGVMGSEIEVSEESGNNIAYIILGVMAVVICSIVAGFVVHKRKIH